MRDLDDMVFWASLPQMADAEDQMIAQFAACLRKRKLPKCVDIRQILEQDASIIPLGSSLERASEIKRLLAIIVQKFEDWSENRLGLCPPPVFIDRVGRNPYDRLNDAQSPLSQILIKQDNDSVRDMADISAVVAGAQRYEICRIYLTDGDNESKTMLKNIMRTVWENEHDAP